MRRNGNAKNGVKYWLIEVFMFLCKPYMKIW